MAYFGFQSRIPCNALFSVLIFLLLSPSRPVSTFCCFLRRSVLVPNITLRFFNIHLDDCAESFGSSRRGPWFTLTPSPPVTNSPAQLTQQTAPGVEYQCPIRVKHLE
jgi:hypothetical protein